MRSIFYADNGITGREVWVTDGTTEGTRQAFDLNPGGAGSVTKQRGMARVGNKLFFGFGISILIVRGRFRNK